MNIDKLIYWYIHLERINFMTTTLVIRLTLWLVIGIDTNIEVIVVSLTTWEAHHSPRAKPEGCGELPRSLMRQQ